MPAPTFSQLATPSASGTGFAPETVSERLLTIAAILASGQNPDGSANTIGSGGLPGYQVVTGADPTGTTDSTVPIQTALSATARQGQWTLRETPGGVCYLPPGQYLISSPLIICPGVRFVGAGTSSTTLVMPSATNKSMIHNGNCDFTGSVIDTFAAYSGNDPQPAAYAFTAATLVSGQTYTFTFASTAGLGVGMYGIITGNGAGGIPNFTCVAIASGGFTATTFRAILPAGVTPNQTGNFFVIPGSIGSSIEQLTINGNGQSAGPSWCMQFYGQGHRFQYVDAIFGYSGCIYSEGSGSAGTFPWPIAAGASLYDVHVAQSTNGHGIQWCGPHDSKWFNVNANNNQQHGIFINGVRAGTSSATKMVSCYSFGNNQANSTNYSNLFCDANTNATSLFDCQMGPLGVVNGSDIQVASNNFNMTGGELLDNGASGGIGINLTGTSQVGISVKGVLGGGVSNALNTIFNFGAGSDGGGNNIDINAANFTTAYTGTPTAKSRILIRGGTGAAANIGPLATALLPGGITAPVSGTAYTNSSGTDIYLTIAVAVTGSVTTAPQITVACNGQTSVWFFPAATGTYYITPNPLYTGRAITITTTSAGGGTVAYTWTGYGA